MLLGLLIGGLGPRSDLREARKEIAALRLEAADRSHFAGQVGQAKAFLGVSDAQIKEHSARKSRVAGVVAATEGPAPALAAQAETNEPAVTAASNQVARGGLEEHLEEATELWNTRAALARNSFITNTDLDAEQVIRFDVLVAGMNIRLEDTIARWADTLSGKGAPAPEDGIRLVNELSDAMVFTYDEMDRNLPEDWREAAGKGFDLTQFIDPAVAMPLVGVEDKLQQPPSRPRRGPPWRRNREGE